MPSEFSLAVIKAKALHIRTRDSDLTPGIQQRYTGTPRPEAMLE